MPRRPRPASRQRPQQSSGPSKINDPPVAKTTSKRSQPDGHSRGPHTEPQTESEEDSEEQGDEDEEDDLSEGAYEEDVDVDAPRVAQYVGEEELDDQLDEASESESSDDEDGFTAGPAHLVSIMRNYHYDSDTNHVRKVYATVRAALCSSEAYHLIHLRSPLDLSSLPLGALRKAQQALSKAKALSDSEDEDDAEDNVGSASQDASDSEPEELDVKGQQKDPATKEKKEIAKRKHKHAYVFTSFTFYDSYNRGVSGRWK